MATDAPTSRAPRIGGVEVRSIDYVPLSERHGKVWSQGPLWFMSNAQIATLAVGTFSVIGGGNLIWSLIAIVAGALIGTFFMAFHCAQGPQLGLPQMIQSRPQFGYVGALLVWLFAYLQYAGFNIFNTILAGDALHATIHGSSKLWISPYAREEMGLFRPAPSRSPDRCETVRRSRGFPCVVTSDRSRRSWPGTSTWPGTRPWRTCACAMRCQACSSESSGESVSTGSDMRLRTGVPLDAVSGLAAGRSETSSPRKTAQAS